MTAVCDAHITFGSLINLPGLSVLLVVCYAALGLQVAFLAIWLAVYAFWKEDTGAQVSLPVSVIVCARNEESNLGILLPLLMNQEHPEYEVIVVNDRSADTSADLMKKLAAADARIRNVSIEEIPPGVNGKKWALTQGIAAARNEVILVTDADCRPGPAWISHMASAFREETKIVLGYSPYLKTSGLLNTFIRFETLLTGIQYMGMARVGFPYMGVGRNLAYRKSFFQESNGFNGFMDVTGGDDDLWVNKNARGANTRVCRGTDALVWSVPKTTWRSFFQQKLRHLSVGLRYRPFHKIVIGLFHASYVLSWILPVLFALLLAASPFVLELFFARIALLMALVVVASVKLGDKFNPWPVILLDFLYVFYYISTALRALFTRKVQWRN